MFIPKHIRTEMVMHERCGEKSASDIQFINIAYRPEPVGFATGGPNGVLKLLRDLVGGSYRGFYSRYIFEPADLPLPKNLTSFFAEHRLGTMTKKLLEAEYFVCSHLHNKLPDKYIARTGAEFVFVCHDIGAAVGAFSAGYPYVLVYHQQGGFAHERESFGEVLNPVERTLMNHYEKVAFENALEVCFPSVGAQKAFESTTVTTDVAKVNFAPAPLYNSADAFETSETAAKGFLIANGCSDLLHPELRQNYLVFITIGDFSHNKGVDRCPQILTEIASRTDKEVVWIALGSRHKSGIFEKLEMMKSKFNFKVVLSPKRLPHDIAMGLVETSDWFLMQQRHAIFDFSSLEAMSLSKGLILSPVEGNLDFDKNNNIIFYDPDAPDSKAVTTVCDSDPSYYGALNKEVFDTVFTRQNFVSGYFDLYDRIIEKKAQPALKPALPDASYENIENAIRGKNVIIMGAGQSASLLTPQEREGKTLIALNRAALIGMYAPDIHIMQDQPHDPNAWSEYLKQDTLRLYGRINRSSQLKNSISFEFLDRMGIEYNRYNLSSVAYDGRVASCNFDDRSNPIQDMMGVFFSAVQLCMLMGAKKILTVGIDFSDQNFDGKNPNIYNSSVMGNFDYLMQQMAEAKADFEILHTTSDQLRFLCDRAYEVDQEKIDRRMMAQRIEETVNSKESPFRQVQSLARAKMFKEVLFYLDTRLKPEEQMERRFLRERIQALKALGKKQNASRLLACLTEELKSDLSRYA